MRGDMGTILWIPEFRSRHAHLGGKAATVVSSLLAIAHFKLLYVARLSRHSRRICPGQKLLSQATCEFCHATFEISWTKDLTIY